MIFPGVPTALTLQLDEVIRFHADVDNLNDNNHLVSYEQLSGGLINATWHCATSTDADSGAGGAEMRNEKHYLVQRLSSSTPAETIQDYTVLFHELNDRGIRIPRQLRVQDSQVKRRRAKNLRHELSSDLPFINCLDQVFRVFEYVDNAPPRKDVDATWRSAGFLLGRVHNALSKIDYEPIAHIPGFHDARGYKDRLERLATKYTAKGNHVRPEVEYIRSGLADAIYFQDDPQQLIHGDPKLQNMLFDPNDGAAATMLVDWDTCMRAPISIDIGDALRSICKTDDHKYDVRRERRFLEGYATGNPHFDADDKVRTRKAASGQIMGAAARYLIDFFEGNYFSYPPTVDAAAENLLRARKGIQYHLAFKRATDNS